MKTFNQIALFFIVLLGWSCATSSSENATTEDNVISDKPNIVVIVSDDHGSRDAGCYGNTVVQTPNIDYLASEGVRFTNAYCTTPSCSASRSVILTGLYNHATGHFGHEHSYNHFSTYNHVKSLPVFLEEYSGYRTARVGKYHVGPESVYKFQKVFNANGRNGVAMADSVKSFIRSKNNKPYCPIFRFFYTTVPVIPIEVEGQLNPIH